MRGAAARAPALSISQPSAGQLSGPIPVTDREPTEPCRASRQSAGVAAAETSAQRRPGTPTSTTCRTGPAATVLAGRTWPAAAVPALSTVAQIAPALASATRTDAATGTLARIGRT